MHRILFRATAFNARGFLDAVVKDMPATIQVDGGSEFRTSSTANPPCRPSLPSSSCTSSSTTATRPHSALDHLTPNEYLVQQEAA